MRVKKKTNQELWVYFSYDAQRGKKALMHYANSEDQDQHEHLCSLIWTFSVPRHILQYPLILLADNGDPDQPARKRRLLRVCDVRKLN